MKNKPFTYVIAPEGCTVCFTPWKRYEVSIIRSNINYYRFNITDDRNRVWSCISKTCCHLNNRDWIIPEIGQWPTGWTRHQKAKCLQNAGVEILTTGFMRIIGEEKGVTTCASTDEYQGRSAKQLEDGYKIFAICFVATIVLIIISLIL